MRTRLCYVVVKYVTMRYACMQEVATVIDVAAITAKHNIVAAKFAIKATPSARAR